jgi:hypothetical protein
LIASGIIIAFLIAIAVWPGEKEPEYQGKTLSEWLYTGWNSPEASPRQAEAADAVRHIGTNALPYLLRAVAYETPPSRKGIYRLMRRVPRAVWDAFGWDEAIRMGSYRASSAMFGFRVLGDKASPAVPSLSQLMRGTNRTFSLNAMAALMWMGNAGLPTLVEAVTNKTSPTPLRTAALSEIGYMRARHTNAASTLPVLFECLREDDPEVVGAAAVALGNFKTEAARVVPALIASMQNSDSHVRREVV